jgi:hypothetical protein
MRTRVTGFLRLAAEVATTFAILAALASLALRVSRAHGDDFVQDYVSARAWLDGESPYRSLNDLRARAGFPPVPGHVLVRSNPHPPGAILLTVPYAGADFAPALFRLRAVQLLAVAITWAAAYRLFEPPAPRWLWAALGGLFGLWAPLWQGLDWGQPVGVLALAVVAVWGLARADRAGRFGLAVGLACTLRPFAAILAVLAAGWPRGRALLAAAAALAGGLLPFLLAGIWPWEWYRLASDAKGYVAECGSLPGVLGLGTAGGVALYALAAVALAVARLRGLGRDPAAALAATAAMLTYPLAWFQYDVSLIPVVAWVAAVGSRAGNRPALAALTAFLVLRTLPDIIPDPHGTGAADVIGRNKGWLQAAARGLLLLAVAAAARRPAPATSANVPS